VPGAVCQIVVMRRNIHRFVGAFAALLASCSAASAQYNMGGADFDQTLQDSNRLGSTPGAPNATLEQLNKILSASQLPPSNRTFYLSIRAFLLNRLGREADSQKDVAEMGKILPGGWPLVLLTTMPGLAGGGDRAAALRTLEYGLQQKPNDPLLLVAQAEVFMQIADFTKANGMLDNAVAGASGPANRRLAVFYRGHANFNLGNYPRAFDDFNSSVDGLTAVKDRLSGVLWRYAAQAHTKQDARTILNKDIGNENLYEWPGPIAKFLLGKLSAGELEVAAESDETAKRTNGKCSSAFFIGIDAERRGDKQRAREQLQLAQARCPTVSPYNWAASSELKRL
jgi:hypothetical protein